MFVCTWKGVFVHVKLCCFTADVADGGRDQSGKDIPCATVQCCYSETLEYNH